MRNVLLALSFLFFAGCSALSKGGRAPGGASPGEGLSPGNGGPVTLPTPPVSTPLPVSNLPPVRASITGPTEIAVNACAGPFRLYLSDAASNATTNPQDRKIALAFEATRGLGRLYSDNLCSTSIAGYNFSAGNVFRDFWLRYQAADVVLLNANDSLGLADAGFRVKVRAPMEALLVSANSLKDTYVFLRYNSSSEKTYLITNVGTEPASDLRATGPGGKWSFKGGAYPGAGGTCGNVLPPGNSCSVVMSIAAGDSESRNATTDFNTLKVQYRSLGVDRSLEINLIAATLPKPIALRFENGPQYFFAPTFSTLISPPRVITVTNFSAVPLTQLSFSLASVFQYEGGRYPGAKGSCTTSLAPGMSCKVSVVFVPGVVTSYSPLVQVASAFFKMGNDPTTDRECAGFTAPPVP